MDNKTICKRKNRKKDLLLLAFCGLFGVSANMLFFFYGLSLTSPIDASIIMTSTPVIVLILSAFILKEKITRNKYIGILIGGIGAAILILYGKTAAGTSSIIGNLFVFFNACSYGLYLVLVKPLMKKYKAFTVISWMFMFGFAFTIPFGIGDLAITDFSAFTTNAYLSLAYVIVGTTFLTYLLNIYALNYVSPSVNGSYIYLQPVVSFIMVSLSAYLFNDTTYAKDISMVKILSCILVIVGVYLISRKKALSFKPRLRSTKK